MYEENQRYVKVLVGGAGELENAAANGRVASFIIQLKERNKLNPNDYYFIKDYFIHNLTLELLKEAGATKLLDTLKLPKDLYCPSALYKFMVKLNGKTPPPKPPKHERVSCHADKGMIRKLDEVKKMCEGIEEYYADAYEYIVNAHSEPNFELKKVKKK